MSQPFYKTVRYLTLTSALVSIAVASPCYAQKDMTMDDARVAAAQSIRNLMPVDINNELFFSALVSTYEYNPTLKAVRARTRGVFERLPQADAGWKPTLDVGAGVDYIDRETDFKSDLLSELDPDGDTTAKDAALVLEQPVYRGGSTMADIKAAKNTIQSQIESLDEVEQGVLLEAATVYLDVLQNETILKLRLNNQIVLREQYDATDKRFGAGELTQTDVAQAQARSIRADAEVIGAQGNLKSSHARFIQIIGYPPERLAFPTLQIPLPSTLEEALQHAEQENPGVKSAEYAQAAAEHDINSIYGELLPRVSIQGRAEKGYDPSVGIDTNDENVIGIFASMPLYEGGAVRSRVREAKHSANQRFEEISEAKRDARERVESAWETLMAANAEKQARLAQVEASAVARFGVAKEADLGARTTLDVLDADQELLDAEVAYVIAQRNELVAHYTLAAAMGVFGPSDLGFGDKVPDYNGEVKAARGHLFSTSVPRPGQ